MVEFNANEFATSLTTNQYRSKKWLVDTLVSSRLLNRRPRILVLGAWYGSFLIPMLKDRIDPSFIIVNDKNQNVLDCAKVLHGDRICSYQCFDVETSVDYINTLSVDLLINTSCEHMFDMSNIVTQSNKTLYALQSCDNKNDPGHINTVGTTDELIRQSNLTHIAFRGRIPLGHKTRFMVIGTKNGIINTE